MQPRHSASPRDKGPLPFLRSIFLQQGGISPPFFSPLRGRLSLAKSERCGSAPRPEKMQNAKSFLFLPLTSPAKWSKQGATLAFLFPPVRRYSTLPCLHFPSTFFERWKKRVLLSFLPTLSEELASLFLFPFLDTVQVAKPTFGYSHLFLLPPNQPLPLQDLIWLEMVSFADLLSPPFSVL